MAIKVNLDKIKERLKQKEEARGKKRDPKKQDILKVETAGITKFRAVPYPHSEDPGAEPIFEAFYHYGIPGFAVFYCPDRNDNQKCHVCDFLWEKIKQNKGTPQNKQWLSMLPKSTTFVVGLVRGREDEGPKFLRITRQRDDKPHEKIDAIWSWFTSEDDEIANWMDPEKGLDIELTYAEADANQKKHIGGAKVLLKSINLARKPSAFGKSGEYEAFLKQVKDINVDICPKKTTDDSLEVLKKWHKTEKAVEAVDSDGTTVSGDDAEDNAVETTDGDDLASKIDELLA